MGGAGRSLLRSWWAARPSEHDRAAYSLAHQVPIRQHGRFFFTPYEKQPRASVRLACGSALAAVDMFSLEVATAIAAIPWPADASDATREARLKWAAAKSGASARKAARREIFEPAAARPRLQLRHGARGSNPQGCLALGGCCTPTPLCK